MQYEEWPIGNHASPYGHPDRYGFIDGQLYIQNRFEFRAHDGKKDAVDLLLSPANRRRRMQVARAIAQTAHALREQEGLANDVINLIHEANRLIARRPMPPRRRKMDIRRIATYCQQFRAYPNQFPGDELPALDLRLRIDFKAYNTDDPYPDVLAYPDNLIQSQEKESTTPAIAAIDSAPLPTATSQGPGSAGVVPAGLLHSLPAKATAIASALLMCLFLAPPLGDRATSGSPTPLAAAKAGQTNAQHIMAPLSAVYSFEQNSPWLGDRPAYGVPILLATGKTGEIQEKAEENSRAQPQRAAPSRGPPAAPGAALRQQTQDDYSYDAAGRLITEQFTDLTPDSHGTLASTAHSYAYDNAGNRLFASEAATVLAFHDDFTVVSDLGAAHPRPAGPTIGYIANNWTAPTHEPANPASLWALTATLLDPTDLTNPPGVVTHQTDQPAALLQTNIDLNLNGNTTLTFDTLAQVTPTENAAPTASDPAYAQLVAAVQRYDDTGDLATQSAVLAGIYLQQQFVPAVPATDATADNPAIPAVPAHFDLTAAPVICAQQPGVTAPHLTVLAPTQSFTGLDYRPVAQGDRLSITVTTHGNSLTVSVFNQDHILIGQALQADISGYGNPSGQFGLISGPVTAANFNNDGPNDPNADPSANAPTLDWRNLASDPPVNGVPPTVLASFDNFVLRGLNTKLNQHYQYNPVHELTGITSDEGTPGPDENFTYDRAGALLTHALSNPRLRPDPYAIPNASPATNLYQNLPDEQQVYTRDMLGRVIRGDRLTIDYTAGLADTRQASVSENLAQFSYYGDSYKVRKRSTRQSGGGTPYQTSLPFYAGDDEVADMNDTGAGNMPTLQEEYLTGGPVGMDEILTQYTPGDFDSTGYARKASHPIQDVNKRVYMTLENTQGQPTQIAERAQYTAFGERTVLQQQSVTGLYTNRWLPRGFKDPLNPLLPATTAPNAFSEPLSAAGQTMGFQGRREEDLPGVMNFRNRLYDPRLGRFLEPDPKNDPMNSNPYAFEANNPIGNLDPMGSSVIVGQTEFEALHAMDPNLGYFAMRSDGNPRYFVYKSHGVRHGGRNDADMTNRINSAGYVWSATLDSHSGKGGSWRDWGFTDAMDTDILQSLREAVGQGSYDADEYGVLLDSLTSVNDSKADAANFKAEYIANVQDKIGVSGWVMTGVAIDMGPGKIAEALVNQNFGEGKEIGGWQDRLLHAGIGIIESAANFADIGKVVVFASGAAFKAAKVGGKALLVRLTEAEAERVGEKLIAEEVGKVAEKAMCFVAGTQVATDQGSIAIEKVKVGDKVWSKDPATGAEGYKTVLSLFTTHPSKLVHLFYIQSENESKTAGKESAKTNEHDLIGTAVHPFWSLSRKQWVEMGALQTGEKLLLSNGESATVVRSTEELAPLGTTFTTYNLEVADWHTYFVKPVTAPPDDPSIWVHNKGNLCEEGVSRAAKAATDFINKGKGTFEEWAERYGSKVKLNAEDIEAIRGQFDLHHVLTNKNWISKAGGGPFSKQFAKLLDKAGMEFDDTIVAVMGHVGPHPQYNKLILQRLSEATEGLTGKEFEQAFRTELDKIMKETVKKGTGLNKLITGG